MPFDDQLRANGSRAGVIYADGAAANFMGGAFPAVQQLHGPIEEQARLACHPHIVLHFANRTSQAWLRSVLLAETDEAKALLRNWQEKTLLAVESIMSSCAGTVRLQFEEIPFREDIDLKPQPYSEKWREEDRFDGGAEEDVKEPEKKRTSVTVVLRWCHLWSIIIYEKLWQENLLHLLRRQSKRWTSSISLWLDASWRACHIIVYRWQGMLHAVAHYVQRLGQMLRNDRRVVFPLMRKKTCSNSILRTFAKTCMLCAPGLATCTNTRTRVSSMLLKVAAESPNIVDFILHISWNSGKRSWWMIGQRKWSRLWSQGPERTLCCLCGPG